MEIKLVCSQKTFLRIYCFRVLIFDLKMSCPDQASTDEDGQRSCEQRSNNSAPTVLLMDGFERWTV